MSGLVACPFCRQLFEPRETRACPDCGLRLEQLSKLPPSYEASLIEPEEELPPHMERLPWTYAGRGRALLFALAVAGLVLFFAPWMRETLPDVRELSGYAFARRLGWMWAPGVAWFVMIPLVATRRSIYRMRGARVAVGFLAGIVLTTILVRVLFTPSSSHVRPVAFEWSWGLYTSAALAVAALAAAMNFGGRLDDLPTQRRSVSGRRPDREHVIRTQRSETLH